ncbi:hypothetical protein [Yersinia phage fHe-Yen9-04]|uniref:Uncharacterized protein n=2 Tax=Eneladusvirus Yen904 TaxID=2560849 RepID=A0A2C9CXA2_9CAUD|nr:Rz-like spanin [Yersinia phage fHe-Yen9-04]SOK58431.1 hypothetical protein [Yersinia phage fHe-Yen9-04]SOK58965.1 hypothetical protein [Yersinia phage fHe-Yen9-03]VUE36200.1 hypothetical protein [Yersinia phage fHe-Yen9-04]
MFNFIKLYKLPIVIVAFILYTVLMLFSGWQVRTYYDGYQQNIVEKVQKVVDTGVSTMQRNQAQGFENIKVNLKEANNKTIIKEPTIVNRIIYAQQCIDQDGVDLLQQYKQESINIREGKK